ncbi:ubiquitin-like small modifier protein 1 [Natronolimnohabitans sp. A-GB9]|uniref:ubiquitin-like small modifier protein 1 n=1 Tax=Natronolimnohabitans sp. A-GB9 TaxID=3069757 RepID=UPI0027B4F07B|nr:ubiquitin-like small modifier protein 1 [Natronolimnohabitans sp. A-GB9]MDQ2051889.1 ubiquitin-like small modifier protein 1 [Natronolimnohabitans sp. A-GB9]
MELECVFFGPFRDAVGQKTVRYETDAATVGELLADLEASYPDLEGQLVVDPEEPTALAGDTVVTKNTRNVAHLDGLETGLEDGDVIRLVPSVYGGCDVIGTRVHA